MKRILMVALLAVVPFSALGNDTLLVEVKQKPKVEIRKICKGDSCTVVNPKESTCEVYVPENTSNYLLGRALAACYEDIASA